MASVRFKIADNKLYAPEHPITVYNHTDPSKSVTIDDILSDTGANSSTLNPKHLKKLGLTFGSGKLFQTTTFGGDESTTEYRYFDLPIRVGNLKPVTSVVKFGDVNHEILGRDFLKNFKTTYRWNEVIYEEVPAAVAKATAALGMLEE